MAIDPRSLRPSEVAALFNSTPLETVTTEREVKRWRERAGARVTAQGDLARIDLVKLTAWLAFERHRQAEAAAAAAPELTGYDAQRERTRLRQLELSKTGRDIGEIPSVIDPARRDRCRLSLGDFCVKYFPTNFAWRWSPTHLRVISKLEEAIVHGGLFAIAMPRGSGKSALCRTACMWGLVYGHRRFVVLIGSNEMHASGEMESIKTHLETNELLLADFPEVCFPIRALERSTQRANLQLYRGRATLMKWGDTVVLPTIEGSKASGGVIRAAGITGQIRGMSHTTADGLTIRPDLVVLDDPQTDESARSPAQCAQREQLISGTILGLGGPGTKMSAVATVTVVQQNDLADSLLSVERNPQWQGERCRMVNTMPADSDLWDEYTKERKAAYAAGLNPESVSALCAKFYIANRKALEEGAAVSWEERRLPGDVTALQTAMNILIDRGPEVFYAEYQNDPGELKDQTDQGVKAADLTSKILSNVPRGTATKNSQFLTAMIDVQGSVLFWMVCCWVENMTGAIVDYGTWRRPHPTSASRPRSDRAWCSSPITCAGGRGPSTAAASSASGGASSTPAGARRATWSTSSAARAGTPR
jgi:hypothetical protein